MSKQPVSYMYIDSNNFLELTKRLFDNKNIKFNWYTLILEIRDIISKKYGSHYFEKAYYFTALSDRADNPEMYDKCKSFLDNIISKIPFIEIVEGYLLKIQITDDIQIDINDPTTYKHKEKKTDVNISTITPATNSRNFKQSNPQI